MKNYLLLPLILWCFPSVAQLQFNTLQEVMTYADARAIAIQQATIGEQIALSEKKEAKSYLLPTFSTSLGYNDNITLQPTLVPAQMFNPEAPEGTFEEFTFGTKYTYSTSFQAQWDILNFQRIFAVQTADVEIEKSKINTEVSRYNTYNQLASTYYSILLTQESIKIYEENVEVAASIYKHAKDKYQEGVISEAELNSAEIKQLQNQRSLNQAISNLDQFYLQLQSQLNTTETIEITDTPENFILATTEIQGIHPEILWQEAEVQKYQSVLKQTKASRLPSLSLAYLNNKNWATNGFMDFSNANTLPQQSFGIQLNMSGLFNSTTKQKINQTKGQLQLQQLQLENTRLIKQKEDDLLQLELRRTSDQLSENKKILGLQKENDAHTENKYQGGLISLDQRLDKYDDLLAIQDAYLQSLAAFTLAQYKIYIRQIDFNPKG